jgi:hypothetical protein
MGYSVLEFFWELRSVAAQRYDAIDINLRSNEKDLPILISHLDALVREASKDSETRTNSIIRSSWGTVSKFGVQFGMFEKYSTDDRLKGELRAFLKTGFVRVPREHS